MSCHFKLRRSGTLLVPRGFTLVEMIVVIAIFGIVTVVVLANLPEFRDRSSLDLVAQEVAIHVRGAQVFAAGGRVGATPTRPTYGLHFNKVTQGQAKFQLFRDIDGGKDFDAIRNCSPGNFNQPLNSTCELEQTYTLSKGFLIPDIKVGRARRDEVDILFTRPKLEPVIAINGNVQSNVESVEIIIQSARTGECRAVKIWNNGQVAVVPHSCNES